MLADANERLRTLQLQAGDMLVLIAIQHRRKKTTDSYQETSILDRRSLRTGRNLGLFTLLYKGFDFMTESSFTDKPSRDARKVMFKKKKFELLAYTFKGQVYHVFLAYVNASCSSRQLHFGGSPGCLQKDSSICLPRLDGQ